MKYLVLALLLCSLLPLSNAYCYRKAFTPGMTRCLDEDDNTWHEVGSTWRNSRCMKCTCTECCAVYSIPRVFAEDCVSVLDLETCEYIVHKKDDPSIRCTVFGSVGK